MSDPDNKKPKRSFLLQSKLAWSFFGVTFAIIGFLWLSNAYFAFTGELPFDFLNISMNEPTLLDQDQVSVAQQDRGPIGDSFGVINSLFSGLAILGLVYAILLQRQELHLVKDERDDTRKILNNQQSALDSQNRLTKKQAFETTFFNLLTLITSSRAGICLPTTHHELKGEPALALIAENVVNNFRKKGSINYRETATYRTTTAHINLFISAALTLEEYEPYFKPEESVHLGILMNAISPSEQILMAFEAYSPDNFLMLRVVDDFGFINEPKSPVLTEVLQKLRE